MIASPQVRERQLTGSRALIVSRSVVRIPPSHTVRCAAFSCVYERFWVIIHLSSPDGICPL
jgi:hypothetical protein